VLLLAPSPPLLFMGQELAATRPFLFFCDFGPDLAEAVTQGRRREFARFARFADPESRAAIPDPGDPATFERSRLSFDDADPAARARVDLHRELLRLRARHIVPRLASGAEPEADFASLDTTGVAVWWRLDDGSVLHLLANLGPEPVAAPMRPPLQAPPLYSNRGGSPPGAGEPMAPWSVYWVLETGGGADR
jgi:1,4-alpha-glucan branching enzyme